MTELLPHIQAWQAQGRRIAVATLVAVYGSSPRQLGAKMIITDKGQMMGSVSGGCVESTVAQEALAVLASGQSRLVDYGISDELAQSAGLTCGGTIQVYIEPLVV